MKFQNQLNVQFEKNMNLMWYILLVVNSAYILKEKLLERSLYVNHDVLSCIINNLY